MLNQTRKLGSTRGRWTEQEIAFVKDNCKTMSNYQIAEKLGRTVNGVTAVMRNNGFRRSCGASWTKWTEEDKQLLRDKYGKVTASKLAEELNRSETTIRTHAGLMGLTDPDRNGVKWSKEEDAVILNNRDTDPIDLVPLLPGRTASSIQHRMYRIRFPELRVHRYVVEKAIGRKLTSDEHIHHINMDHTDNRVENLALLSNREHQLAHGSVNRVVKDLVDANIIRFNTATKIYEIV